MRLSVAAAVIFGLAGTGILVGLGVWQLQRLERKEALIARLDARLAAEPLPLPAHPDPARDDYLRVRITGRVGEDELHVLTSLRPWGPGFRVIAPVTDGERTVMVDLGYVPEAAKEARPRFTGPVEVVGALYWPRETDRFAPEPDRKANIWFARELAPMAAALGAEPVLIVAESVAPAHGARSDWPKPLRLGANLPNDHLQYAITWFALALVWAVMTALLVRRERQRPDAR